MSITVGGTTRSNAATRGASIQQKNTPVEVKLEKNNQNKNFGTEATITQNNDGSLNVPTASTQQTSTPAPLFSSQPISRADQYSPNQKPVATSTIQPSGNNPKPDIGAGVSTTTFTSNQLQSRYSSTNKGSTITQRPDLTSSQSNNAAQEAALQKAGFIPPKQNTNKPSNVSRVPNLFGAPAPETSGNPVRPFGFKGVFPNFSQQGEVTGAKPATTSREFIGNILTLPKDFARGTYGAIVKNEDPFAQEGGFVTARNRIQADISGAALLGAKFVENKGAIEKKIPVVGEGLSMYSKTTENLFRGVAAEEAAPEEFFIAQGAGRAIKGIYGFGVNTLVGTGSRFGTSAGKGLVFIEKVTGPAVVSSTVLEFKPSGGLQFKPAEKIGRELPANLGFLQGYVGNPESGVNPRITAAVSEDIRSAVPFKLPYIEKVNYLSTDKSGNYYSETVLGVRRGTNYIKSGDKGVDKVLNSGRALISYSKDQGFALGEKRIGARIQENLLSQGGDMAVRFKPTSQGVEFYTPQAPGVTVETGNIGSSRAIYLQQTPEQQALARAGIDLSLRVNEANIKSAPLVEPTVTSRFYKEEVKDIMGVAKARKLTLKGGASQTAQGVQRDIIDARGRVVGKKGFEDIKDLDFDTVQATERAANQIAGEKVSILRTNAPKYAAANLPDSILGKQTVTKVGDITLTGNVVKRNIKIPRQGTEFLYRTNPSKPNVVEKSINKNILGHGKFETSIEVLGGDEPETSPYYFGILKAGVPRVAKSGIPYTNLAEEQRNLIASTLTVTKSKSGEVSFSPPPQRLKDIRNQQYVAEQISRVSGKSEIYEKSKAYKELFPETSTRVQGRLGSVSASYPSSSSVVLISPSIFKSSSSSNAKVSRSVSRSKSSSPSPSISQSFSRSISTSPSPSFSISPSLSKSPSPSVSRSPSFSIKSPSPSTSRSPSPSPSPSRSSSFSPPSISFSNPPDNPRRPKFANQGRGGKFRYAPSLTAGAFNLKSPKGIKGATLTGIELRGLPEGAKPSKGIKDFNRRAVDTLGRIKGKR